MATKEGLSTAVLVRNSASAWAGRRHLGLVLQRITRREATATELDGQPAATGAAQKIGRLLCGDGSFGSAAHLKREAASAADASEG